MNEQQLDIEEVSDFDLLKFIKALWEKRLVIFLFFLTGTVIGTFYALNAPKQYTVTTIMVPQLSNNSSKSSLSSLAALAGIDMDLNKGGGDLSPLIYPRIVNSIPFKLELMNTKYDFSNYKNKISLYDYYTKYYKPGLIDIIKKYTIGFPKMLVSLFQSQTKMSLSGSGTSKEIQINKTQYVIMNLLDNSIQLNVDKKEGVISLTVTSFEPLLTAQIATKAQDLLQDKVTKFKIEKTQADLDFIQERYNVAKKEFEKVQVDLAFVSDRNRDLVSGLSSIDRDRIQSKYTISYGVFQELAKQLEQAKIQVKRDTPVFTIVEPVVVPIERSQPNRIRIIFTWMILSSIIGIGYTYLIKSVKVFKVKWESIDIN